MAWRLVIQPNGLFARFSTVVDDFTHYDMDEAEVLATAFKEWDCGGKTARDKMERARREEDPSSGAPRPPLSRFRECIDDIREVHGEDAAKERERELSDVPAFTFENVQPGDELFDSEGRRGFVTRVTRRFEANKPSEGFVTIGDGLVLSEKEFNERGFKRA